MKIELAALILALIYPIVLLPEFKALRMRAPEDETFAFSDIICATTPFWALYFHENFWQAIVYFVLPLNAYCVAIGFALARWKKLNFFLLINPAAVAGGYMLSILIYYLAFDQGSLATESVKATGSAPGSILYWSYWLPFVVILGAGAMTAAANRERWVFPLGIILLLTPFFAFYTLWGMLLATVIYFFTCISIANKQDNQAYFAAFMIYMMGQLATLIIYAIFF
ncbi:MAG TPA: hypothetical protein PK129_02820 [Cellvibrionaceae bacterium]|nr:hypothetical protein [Cellvibrionaceae bacterium]